MKTINQPLKEFITDYKLKPEDHSICFDATIYFSTETDFISLSTEVEIISIGETIMDVINLLHPDVLVHRIPDTYLVNEHEIAYLKNRALIIKGQAPEHGWFVLSIHADGACDEYTLMELHGKTLN
ncbi:hypothetical protein [Ferruginibacter albus]|uniref:hypothetical protein n=1 Tax=Ferruginibacter albus TaxID=2875540 RepID=UPI001CC635DB|nr:hypothetical protein [Ferruginibacter albus]UAY53066.1 hypothetical protein K9M53_05155 [Ferruginibacter albus]